MRLTLTGFGRTLVDVTVLEEPETYELDVDDLAAVPRSFGFGATDAKVDTADETMLDFTDL